MVQAQNLVYSLLHRQPSPHKARRYTEGGQDISPKAVSHMRLEDTLRGRFGVFSILSSSCYIRYASPRLRCRWR